MRDFGGTKFEQPAVPTSISKMEDGRLEVLYNANGTEKKVRL